MSAEKRKIVAMCGSLRFREQIEEMAEQLQLQKGYVALGIVPHVLNRELTETERALMGELHRCRIDLADAIFVVNVGGYIGEAVKREIAYARGLGKEILYLEEE